MLVGQRVAAEPAAPRGGAAAPPVVVRALAGTTIVVAEPAVVVRLVCGNAVPVPAGNPFVSIVGVGEPSVGNPFGPIASVAAPFGAAVTATGNPFAPKTKPPVWSVRPPGPGVARTRSPKNTCCWIVALKGLAAAPARGETTTVSTAVDDAAGPVGPRNTT